MRGWGGPGVARPGSQPETVSWGVGAEARPAPGFSPGNPVPLCFSSPQAPQPASGQNGPSPRAAPRWTSRGGNSPSRADVGGTGEGVSTGLTREEEEAAGCPLPATT